MTVAIGLVCRDGVIVASDSMSSDQMVASKGQKVQAFSLCPMLLTSSGSVFVIEEVKLALDKGVDVVAKDGKAAAIYLTPDLPMIRNKLSAVIKGKMLECYQSALSTTPLEPGRIMPGFETNFLVLGYSNDQPWFLEFAHNGEVNWHTDRRFYATGSGGPFANVAMGLMSHYVTGDLSIEHGKMIAYRTIDTTINVSAGLVGPPVQIAICDKDGARLLDDAAIGEIATGVERWKTLESETLRAYPGTESLSAAGDLPALGDPED